MRLAYTSDLHTDATPLNAALLPHLAQRVREIAPDALVLAGDVAETLDAVRAALTAFASIRVPKFYMAGNHDLFVEGTPGPGATSQDKYERLLPAVAAECGFLYLGLEPHRVGDVALLGVTGWYDHAFRDPVLDVVVAPAQYRDGRWRDVRAFDRGHVFWPAADAAARAAATLPAAAPASAPGRWAADDAIDAYMRAALTQQVQRVLHGDPAGSPSTVLAVVHVLPFAELVVRGAFGPVPFHDAWLGSAALGTALRAIPGLRAVVTGHLHRAARIQIDGITVVASPVGTLRDAGIDLAATARERIGVLEV